MISTPLAVTPLNAARLASDSLATAPFDQKRPGNSDSAVSVFEALTPSQIAAVQSGTPVAFLADAINEALKSLSSKGGRVIVPVGTYDLRAPLILPPLITLVGEALSFPEPTYNPGSRRRSGVVFFKNHGGNAIEVIGADTYDVCGGIYSVCISGNGAKNPTGHGLVIDKLGSYRIGEVRVFSVGGDGIVLGLSPGDVTGQIHMDGVYVNNPGGACIRNRSKWLKASQVETDGGVYSYYATNCPNTDFSQFHFEGPSRAAIILAGANGNSRFAGGYIGLTNPASQKAVELSSTAGNTDVLFDQIMVNGHGTVAMGIDIKPAAWRTVVRNCFLSEFPVGVLDRGKGTEISGTSFLGCRLPIDSHSNYSRYFGNLFDGTTGSWAIDHKGGGRGVWSGNITDKPFKPTAAGGQYGNFASHIVKDNPGFKTLARGKTGSITSGTKVLHGLSVTPSTVFVHPLAIAPSDFVYTWDENNIEATWTGPNLSFAWEASAMCESP